MILKEALVSSTDERVRGIARFYGLLEPTGTLSESASLEDVASHISSHLLVPANAVVAMNGLDQEEVLALRLITLAVGGAGVVIEQCHQKLNQLSRKWRRNGAKVIDALISRGLTYVRREGYRHIYFVPSDLRAVLSQFFLEDLFRSSCVDMPKFQPRHRSDYAAPLRHMTIFLSYFRKHEVKITQAGSMFKKAQTDLANLIGEGDEPQEDAMFPMRYPPRLAFLFFFSKTQNLIEERNGVLKLSPKAEEWVQSDCRQCRQELFDYWRQTFISPDVDLQTMLWIIVQAPEGSIFSVDSLIKAMRTLSTSHSSHGLNLRTERTLIDTLEYLGGAEVSASPAGLFVRPTVLGKAMFAMEKWPTETWDDHIYVQSNFEILVPCTIAPKILWSIDAFAELHKPDQMMVYKLTRNSVYRAMLHSLTPQRIEEILFRHSKTPVAQNVTYSVSHWGTSFGRIEFQETILVKCDTEELTDELLLYPKVKQYVKKRVGPNYFCVDGADYDSLVAVLADEGYMPKVPRPKQLQPQPQT